MNLSTIISDWNAGRYGSLAKAYAEEPDSFKPYPKAEEIEFLYRGQLLAVREFAKLVRDGRLVDFGRLETWHTDDHVPIPEPYSPYLLRVVFRRRVPIADRILQVSKNRIVCVTQTVIAEDVWWAQNQYYTLDRDDYAKFLYLLRQHKNG